MPLKPRAAILFLLLVLVPLAGLSWLGVRLARSEEQAVERRFTELLEGRLREVDGEIGAWLRGLERELAAALREPGATPRHPAARQFFLLDPDGNLLQPAGPATPEMAAFLGRITDLVMKRDLWHASRQGGDQKGAAASGWYDWYEGRGLNLVYWVRRTDGSIAAFEINRPRLTADLIAALPDTPSTTTGASERLRLTDEKGASVYEWGGWEPGEGHVANARIAVSAPLSSWHLELHTPLGAVPTGFSSLPLLAGIGALALALVALAFVLHREFHRNLREAERRMSFVSQVSHELKTPLTNIRLYAELLGESLPEECEDERRHAGILVGESRRLSRLIDNVLAFSREHQHRMRLRLSTGQLDEVVREVLEQFAPALVDAGITVETALASGTEFPFDRDAVAQVLANLLGNVEKYAAPGGWVRVSTERRDGMVVLRVADRGPGIPVAHRRRIFEPFHRVDDSLTSGAAGTGIGLSIARSLARLHGGDLLLVAADGGATFELRLPVDPRPGPA